MSWYGSAGPGTARWHVVTGKGGTGKTTVAAALATALASSGRTVLLVEVEERQGISQVLDLPPLGAAEVPVAQGLGGGVVNAMSIEAGAALVEYLRMFYRLGSAGGLLQRMGAIEFATTIAPGVRDVLLTGKVYEALRRTADGRHAAPTGRPLPGPGGAWAYDDVVLDAPPTGRVGRFLDVTAHLADLAKVGPIRSQADAISAVVHSPTTVLHLVTLLEPMPVQETADAVAELAAAGLTIGAVVVNQATAPGTDDDLPAPPPDSAELSPLLERAGIRPTAALVDGLRRTALEAVTARDQRAGLLDDVRALGRPVLQVPSIAGGIGPDAVRRLALALRDQGVGR